MNEFSQELSVAMVTSSHVWLAPQRHLAKKQQYMIAWYEAHKICTQENC